MNLLRRTIANGCVSFTTMVIVYTIMGNMSVYTINNQVVAEFLTLVVKDFFITCFSASFAMSIFDYFDDFSFPVSSFIRIVIINVVVIGLGGFVLHMFPPELGWVSAVSGMVIIAYFSVYFVLYLKSKSEENKINQILSMRKDNYNG